jgi:hypothetical protein
MQTDSAWEAGASRAYNLTIVHIHQITCLAGSLQDAITFVGFFINICKSKFLR